MQILVLEDEHLVAASLIRLLRQLEPAAVIEGPLASIKEAKARLSSALPDLIISDIQLADGISLDVFSGQKIQCPVIFTTAFNEYAIRAFKVNSIDYLLKPVDRSELRSALDKYYLLQSKFANDSYVQQLHELFSDFKNSRKYKERFAVHSGRSIVLIAAEEVACFVKEEIIFLVNTEGRKFVTDFRSLDEVEELLDPACFYRANRQFIVRLQAIGSIRTDETSKINLKLKLPHSPEVLISKEKAAAFRKWVEG